MSISHSVSWDGAGRAGQGRAGGQACNTRQYQYLDMYNVGDNFLSLFISWSSTPSPFSSHVIDASLLLRGTQLKGQSPPKGLTASLYLIVEPWQSNNSLRNSFGQSRRSPGWPLARLGDDSEAVQGVSFGLGNRLVVFVAAALCRSIPKRERERERGSERGRESRALSIERAHVIFRACFCSWSSGAHQAGFQTT